MWKKKKNNQIQNDDFNDFNEDDFLNDNDLNDDDDVEKDIFQQFEYDYENDEEFNDKSTKKKSKRSRNKEFYVKGSDLIREIKKYQQSKKEDALKRNVPLEQGIGIISEDLGDMIIKICTRFSMHPRFYGYSFRDEFVADAVARCITHAVNKINLDLPNCNVFAYFTQCAYNVFRQKIKSQKKYNQTKQKFRQQVYTDFQNQQGVQNTKQNQQEL